MAPFLRLLALSLLLSFALPSAANEKIGKNDLDAQKELLQLKIDSGRELVQKDFESFKSRIDAVDKRIDDQNNRVGDIGQSVDRFAVIVGSGGLLLTVLLAFGGLVGYFSVAKKAADEAKAASQKWFDDNQQKLTNRTRELEQATEQACQKIDSSVTRAQQHSDAAIKQIQEGMNTPNEQGQPISPIEQEALHKSAEQIRGRPEASYSFEDWNKRAFDAYRSGQFEDAALYWKHASSIPNAGVANTAQALSNRAITLNRLDRHNEACTTYEQLITIYSSDDTPAIREQVAKAMNNMGIILGQMQKPDESIAAYEKLIATFSSDNSPAIREQVAKAMTNMGVTLGEMQKPDEAIAAYEKQIAIYSPDNTPAIREQVAGGMLNIGVALGQMQKPDEAIAAYEKQIATYSPDNTPAIRRQVARAMLNMGVMLGQMKKADEEIATYEKLIATYSLDNTPAIREQVAGAMFNIGIALEQMQKSDKAIAAYEKLITTYSPDNAPAVREQVAKAMTNMGATLEKMQKPDAAIAAYERLISTYSPDNTPAIREQVASAFNGKGFTRLMEAKRIWGENSCRAFTLLREAQTDLLAGLDRLADCGITRGNLAYVQWLLGDWQSAEKSFQTALAAARNGAEALYHPTLEDIKRHPIQEDDSFRSMIDRLWAEFQTAKSNGE